MQSIWRETTLLRPRGPLPGNLEADVAVIGGGMAGVLTAYFLRQKGRRPIILEARRLAGGQTERTTAKITAQHGLKYAQLIRDHGEERALQYAEANRQAIRDYRDLAAALGIKCKYEECPAYLYSCVERDCLEEELAAARSLGFEAELTRDTELPFPVKSALRFDHQARFHPLRFLEALAEELTVFEDTEVLTLDGNRLETNRGTVEANQVVFASHYPFRNVPGYYFLRMHQERSYVAAVEGAPPISGMYYGVDQESGWSLRQAGDLLLLGGGNHRTGENSEGGQYAALEAKAAELWPGCRVAARWSAQDCMPLDGVPYIGPFSSAEKSWFVATGFQKWGMTASMAAARLLSSLMCGEESPWAEVFSPQRFQLSASAKQLFEEGTQAVKGLAREWLIPPKEALEQLAPGRGGILSWQDKKVGAYRDERGTFYLVDPRCPHLGCRLEWNPDELSWDCPCHGSRFDYRGNLLDGPAQEGLRHE